MKILIVESDTIRRKKLQNIFSTLGYCTFAFDCKEAIEAYKLSWTECKPYDLISIDITMVNIYGLQLLDEIHEIENEMGIQNSNGVKLIMTEELDNINITFNKHYEKEMAVYRYRAVGIQESLEDTLILGLPV